MQSSWELHNIITYPHNLTQLASIMDASTPPMVIWALPYNSQGRWWKWGNNSMYRMCLQLAWWWLEYYPLWWKGRFRSAQFPQVDAYLVWFDNFLNLNLVFSLFKRRECINKTCFASQLPSINCWIGWCWGKYFWSRDQVFIKLLRRKVCKQQWKNIVI